MEIVCEKTFLEDVTLNDLFAMTGSTVGGADNLTHVGSSVIRRSNIKVEDKTRDYRNHCIVVRSDFPDGFMDLER